MRFLFGLVFCFAQFGLLLEWNYSLFCCWEESYLVEMRMEKSMWIEDYVEW